MWNSIGQFSEYLGANSNEWQALSALLTAIAVIPAGLFFIRTQFLEARALAQTKYNESHADYNDFLALCLQHPEVRAMYTDDPIPATKLSDEKKIIRDTIFDAFTAMIERAYLAYRDPFSSFRESQWRGWEAHIDSYLDREDYMDWWLRVMGEGSWENAVAWEYTTYDVAFESYIVERIVKRLEHKLAPALFARVRSEFNRRPQRRWSGGWKVPKVIAAA